ncbi:semaphorin-3A-like [Ascaphus truei]|uniref:semaphorin-3A-like n=1 Tax=Ascaphus truei TaxID=8439 RepID=UPI003F5A80D0
MYTAEQERLTVQERRLFAVEGSSVFLECLPKSLRAQVTWTYHKSPDVPRKEVQFDERVIGTERGVLLRSALRRDAGTYLCHSSEHGFSQTLLRLLLEVIPSSRAEDPPGSHRGASLRWYQDFLRLVQQPSSAEQVCEELWIRRGRTPHQPGPLGPPHQPGLQGPPHQPGLQGPPQRPFTPLSIKAKAQKWKHLEDKRKVRSRRTHSPPTRAERGPRSASS